MEDARIGTVVGERYKILERISEGAMGAVYRAERLQLGRVVAVKFLHTGLAKTREFLERFDREARMMSRLNHPHCVSVIDFGVADAPYIVMDHVTGTTLRQVLDDADGPVPAPRALHIVRQVLSGLAHAHEVGIIHRDIKPANVMLAQLTGTGDHVRILDFGLAKLLDADQSSSRNVIGTPSYMSPEQAQGKPVDARSDVYGTTILLFELLTGHKPFEADDMLKVVRMQIAAPAPTLHDVAPDVEFSPELERLIARGLAKAPADRFQTPHDMAAAFDEVPEAMTRDSGAHVARPRAASQPARARPASEPARPERPRSERPDPSPVPAPVPVPVDARAPTVPVQTARAREAAAIRAALKASRSRARRLLLWLVILGLVAGAVVTWNALGRPGLGSDDASAPPPTTPATQDRELAQLEDEVKKHPKDWGLHYRLGRLYTDAGKRADGIAAYGRAIDGAGRYRWNARLTRDMIDALADTSTRDAARAMLIQKIGAPALPHLRTAQASKDDVVRREVGKVIAEIEAHPP